ncbi:MAG: TrmH family RNA methyltransferase [Candidatus Pacebacteria bacterium]|nr:TrmH family RNA methyltransferase [Candidatus Paceibacterota bacterium]
MEIVVVLSGIRSLHNIGSIFRTSDATGVKKVYLCGITPKPVDRFGNAEKNLEKVSLGAEKWIPWEYFKTTSQVIKSLKISDYYIISLEQSKKSINFKTLDKNLKSKNISKIAIILGGEVDGVSKTILEKSDTILEIPMYGKKESLNVSVAYGIAVYGILSSRNV